MAELLRLMPHHDPCWRDKLDRARARRADLLSREGILSATEQRELERLRSYIAKAFNARFRTTAEYRDFHFARARAVLEAEGIEVPLPDLPNDATVEEIDRALRPVWRRLGTVVAHLS